MSNDFIPGLQGVPAAKSSIAHINGEKGILYYRGFPIEVLAEQSTFEETAYLLLHGDLPSKTQLEAYTTAIKNGRKIHDDTIAAMKTLPKNTHPMHALQTAVTALTPHAGSSDILSESPDNPERQRYINEVSVALTGAFPTIVAYWDRIRKDQPLPEPRDDLNQAAYFLWLLTGKEPDEFTARLFDICLILHAEHTFNASTFTVRVTGSTLAHPYPVMASGVASLSGPLHGGANEQVLLMLAKIGSPDNAESFVEEQLAQKKKIWGLGHREYKTKDPRAKILEKLVRDFSAHKSGNVDPLFEIALAVEQAADKKLSAKGVYPNVDFYSGIVYKEMAIPTDLFTPVFAISRIAGWTAHWKEQMSNNRIYRPTQIYTGEVDRVYTPLDKR